MKNLRGTIFIATVLMAHIGIAVATEKSYTFSSSDYHPEYDPTPSHVSATPANYFEGDNMSTGNTARYPSVILATF